MPFTFAHPAAVLPFLRNERISWTGLIMGSMVPDFEYFVRLRLTGDFGHTWWGILYFDVPLGLLLAVIFHAWVKKPLILNSPKFLKRRWIRFADLPWFPYLRKYWWNVLKALAFGAFTHVLWDAFTHNGTFITAAFPVLRTQISLYFEEYPLYHLLQHASSGIGLLLVTRYLLAMPAAPLNTAKKTPYWSWVAVINFLISGFTLYQMSLHEQIKIGHVVVIGLGGFLYALILVGGWLRWQSHANEPSPK